MPDRTFTEMCDETEFLLNADFLPAEALWCIEPVKFQLMLDAVNREFQAARNSGRMIPRGNSQRRANVAIIPITGPMSKTPSFFQFLFGGGLGPTVEAKLAVKAATMDNDIDKILLLIDSPGGSVEGLAELVDAVTAAAEQKEVIVQVEGMMASAALHVGSQATQIFANRMDMIGSIGARMMVFDTSEMFERDGIKVHAIDTGEHKSAGAPGTVVTPAHLTQFQGIVDAFFKDFTEGVSKGRNMTMANVLQLADGRMFMADEALANGLIDGIQTKEETLLQMTGASNQVIGRTSASLSRQVDLAEKEFEQMALDDL